MATFVGQFPYKVDEKGRIPIPPSFRHDLADGGFLTPGQEGCIAIYTRAKFEEIAHTLQSTGLPKGDNRVLSRRLFSKATELKLDGQGRAMLPPELRQIAEITDSATVVGVNSYAEIWSPQRWKAQEEKPAQEVWEIIDTIELTKDKPE